MLKKVKEGLDLDCLEENVEEPNQEEICLAIEIAASVAWEERAYVFDLPAFHQLEAGRRRAEARYFNEQKKNAKFSPSQLRRK